MPQLAFAALKARWKGRSEEDIWDFIDQHLAYIAEHLRDEASTCVIDGSAPKFEIDDEQPAYVRAVGARTTDLLRHVRSIDPFKVEDICADVLRAFGAEAHSTQRTADGGIDFVATAMNIVPAAFTVPIGCKATIIGQTKRYKEGYAITERHLREFVGAAILKKHQLQRDGRLNPLSPVIFAFWTTSDFEPNAKVFARDVGLWFMDGHTLATYLHNLEMADAVMTIPLVPPCNASPAPSERG